MQKMFGAAAVTAIVGGLMVRELLTARHYMRGGSRFDRQEAVQIAAARLTGGLALIGTAWVLAL